MTALVTLPATVRGLPLHPLVVHGVVVLIPLAAIGAIACAIWPAARRRYGTIVVLGTAVATAFVPLATGSGEDFQSQLRVEELVRDHANWAERVLPTMLVLLVSVLALVLLDILQRGSRATAGADTARSRATVGAGAGRSGGVGSGGDETSSSDETSSARTEGGEHLTGVDRRINAAMPAGLRTAAAAGRLSVASIIVAVIVVIVAVIALYVVFQTGESGSRAVWNGR